jgi:hypothetical protein
VKIRLYCDSGANVKSKREEVVDTVKDWDMEEGEWEAMSDEDRQKEVDQWAWDRLEIGWTPVEE